MHFQVGNSLKDLASSPKDAETDLCPTILVEMH